MKDLKNDRNIKEYNRIIGIVTITIGMIGISAGLMTNDYTMMSISCAIELVGIIIILITNPPWKKR